MSENLFPKGLYCSLSQVATNPSPDAQFSLYLQLCETFSGLKKQVLFSSLCIFCLRPVILLIKVRKLDSKCTNKCLMKNSDLLFTSSFLLRKTSL